MRGARIRNPLERTLMAASALLGFAAILWALAIVISWNSKCPESGDFPTGLDKGISLWPPGAECYPGPLREGEGFGGNDIVAYEAIPSLKWLILALAVTAVAILIVGLAASINSLRSRPRPGRV